MQENLIPGGATIAFIMREHVFQLAIDASGTYSTG
jgi:hypothetical protein